MKKQFRIAVEKEEVADRLARFAALNTWVTERGGWVISLPGADEALVEALPGSALPEELRHVGYDVVHVGEAERILPAAVEQRFTTGPDGELEPLVAGSTRALALTVTHAGITRVQRYSFSAR